MPYVNLNALPMSLKQLAEWCEANGNKGWYWRDIPGDMSWVLHPEFKKYRDGIVYYSAGHGWRVRKKPHWRKVYDKRFANWG